jgi:hypothetical protein
MDSLANIDYYEEPITSTDKQATNAREKHKQHHNEVITHHFFFEYLLCFIFIGLS